MHLQHFSANISDDPKIVLTIEITSLATQIVFLAISLQHRAQTSDILICCDYFWLFFFLYENSNINIVSYTKRANRKRHNPICARTQYNFSSEFNFDYFCYALLHCTIALDPNPNTHHTRSNFRCKVSHSDNTDLRNMLCYSI